MAEREPGQLAFEAFSNCMRWPKTWGELYDDSRRAWSAVEAATRADERERVSRDAREIWKHQDTFMCSDPKSDRCREQCDEVCVEAVEALASAIRSGGDA